MPGPICLGVIACISYITSLQLSAGNYSNWELWSLSEAGTHVLRLLTYGLTWYYSSFQSILSTLTPTTLQLPTKLVREQMSHYITLLHQRPHNYHVCYYLQYIKDYHDYSQHKIFLKITFYIQQNCIFLTFITLQYRSLYCCQTRLTMV